MNSPNLHEDGKGKVTHHENPYIVDAYPTTETKIDNVTITDVYIDNYTNVFKSIVENPDNVVIHYHDTQRTYNIYTFSRYENEEYFYVNVRISKTAGVIRGMIACNETESKHYS